MGSGPRSELVVHTWTQTQTHTPHRTQAALPKHAGLHRHTHAVSSPRHDEGLCDPTPARLGLRVTFFGSLLSFLAAWTGLCTSAAGVSGAGGCRACGGASEPGEVLKEPWGDRAQLSGGASRPARRTRGAGEAPLPGSPALRTRSSRGPRRSQCGSWNPLGQREGGSGTHTSMEDRGGLRDRIVQKDVHPRAETIFSIHLNGHFYFLRDTIF